MAIGREGGLPRGVGGADQSRLHSLLVIQYAVGDWVDLGLGVSVEAEVEEGRCRPCDGAVLDIYDVVNELEVRLVRDDVPVGTLERDESGT